MARPATESTASASAHCHRERGERVLVYLRKYRQHRFQKGEQHLGGGREGRTPRKSARACPTRSVRRQMQINDITLVWSRYRTELVRGQTIDSKRGTRARATNRAQVFVCSQILADALTFVRSRMSLISARSDSDEARICHE
jgi:hypothetical protein